MLTVVLVMSLNLGSILANAASIHGSRTALLSASDTWTYAAADGEARRFAAALLAAGIQPGDRIGLMAPNSPHFTLAYYGALYAGATVVTLNTLQSAAEVAFQLADCGATALVLHADCSDAGLPAFETADRCRLLYHLGQSANAWPTGTMSLEDALATEDMAEVYAGMPDDTAVIQYTSGTTGQPKGAELTHFNLYCNAQYVSERAFSIWPETINLLGPGHVGLAALPLYHTFGQTNVQNGMLFNGGAISYLSRFDPLAAVEAMARDRVTFFPAVPTMYFAILHDERTQSADLSRLRYCVSGGAPIPVEVKRRFEDQFAVRIQEGYGLTETSPLASCQRIDETHKCGTIGKPIAGVEFRIVDENDRDVPPGERGEIVIRGPNIMKGYYGQPEATAHALRGGWFHSGDIGYIDGDGDVVIVDRKKDMILRGGYNVYPREIEEVLYTHPAVREAAVIGIPDERYGEEVKAVISLKPKCVATSEEVITFCKQHVAAYKYPRVVEILDDLPKGPTGKLLKRALRPS